MKRSEPSESEQRVLIMGRDGEMISILAAALKDEQYAATYEVLDLATTTPAQVVECVRREHPDLLVLVFGPWREATFALLDALRADEEASHAPILAISTMPDQVQESLSSYNVRDSLASPFDLDEFLAKASRILQAPTLHADLPEDLHAPPPLRPAEELITARSREILMRWVMRLRQQPPWEERDDLKLSEVIDSMPVALEAVNAAVKYGSTRALVQNQEQALDRVREHARTRRLQGIKLVDTVREYTLLRNEIWNAFRRTTLSMTVEDVLVLEEAVNLTLDLVIETTINTYMDD